MGQLSHLVAKLQRLKASLNVRPFYITHLPKWQEHAQRIAVAILQTGKPNGADPDVWRVRVEAESARLSGLLFFSEEEVGAIIGIGIRPAGTSANDPKNFSVEGVSIDEVERWVAAGRTKGSSEEVGKNLDERDYAKSDLQIAWRVLYAMKLQKPGWEKLLGHIEDFLGASEQGAAVGLYADILQAWLDQLAPQIIQDFRDWFHTQVTTSMAG